MRRVAASHIKAYHMRPPSLRCNFGDEHAHVFRGPDLWLAPASTLASLIYTLMDRWPTKLLNGSWEWRYHGRYLNSFLSGVIPESECLNSSTPLQLDVFHDLLCHPPHHRPRPALKLTSSKSLVANRSHALLEAPIGTVVWRDFTDKQERIQRYHTEVYSYKTPYRRVRHSDGDWEELIRPEVEQGRDILSASTILTSKVSKEKSRKSSPSTDPLTVSLIIQDCLL